VSSPAAAKGAVFAFPDGVHGLPHVRHDVIPVEDRLRGRVRHLGADGLGIGLPHIERDRFDAGDLIRL
jgi:hypothetical protein